MTKATLQHLKRIDWILVAVASALVGFGLVTLSSLAANNVVDAALFWKQTGYGIVGLLTAAWLSFLNYRLFVRYGSVVLVCYGIALVFLAGLFLFGETIRGVRAWYRVGEFSVAPVEFVKIALLVLLAKFFSDRHRDLYTARHIFLSLGYAGIAMLLVLSQPDLGSALVIAVLWLGMVLFSGIRTRYVALLFLGALVTLAFLWQYALADYQKGRIRAFANPQAQARGFGYNTIQANIAVGAGGFWGRGFGEGSQSGNKFLPESSTDFIFAAAAEEYGFFGTMAIFALFAALWYRVLGVGYYAMHNFGRLFAFGFALLIATHFFITAGMNLGMLPVIGLPLPFLSYGGSHLLASFLGLGILLAIQTRGNRYATTEG